LPEVSKASKDGNWVKGGAAVGDISLAVIPAKLVKDNLLAKSFAEKASGYYAAGKIGIEYTAAAASLSIYGGRIQQLDSQNMKRLYEIQLRGERMKKLEEDQKQIKAETEQRAKMINAQ
jgi:hypothetical protein